MFFNVDEEGYANWITGVPTSGQATPGEVVLRTVTLDDISARYKNERTGLQLEGRIDRLAMHSPIVSRHVDFELSAELAGVPIDLEGSFDPKRDILTGNRFPVEFTGEIGDVDVDANVEIGPAPQGDIQTIDVNARVRVAGNNLFDIGSALDWPLPATDIFTIEAQLSGDRTHLSLSDIDGAANWDGHDLVVTGRVANVLDWTGLELDARLDGQDLSGLSHLYSMDWLPGTDAYEVAGNVTGDWPALGIREGDLSLVFDDVVMDASGMVADLDALTGFDTDVGFNGEDLASLTPLFNLPPVQTKSFNLKGKLNGNWPALGVSGGSVSLVRDEMSLRATGSVDNLIDPSAIDIDVATKGRDLAAVPEFEKLELPVTDAFEFEGQFKGSQTQMSLTGMSAGFERGSHRVGLSGGVAAVPDFKGINWTVEAAGTDLAELNDLFTMRFLQTRHYDMSFLLDGDIDNFRASDIVVDGAMSRNHGDATREHRQSRRFPGHRYSGDGGHRQPRWRRGLPWP